MNFLEKSRVQQLVHGVPYKPRNNQPSMFQILSWNAGDVETLQNNQQQQHYHQQHYCPHNYNNSQSLGKQNLQNQSQQENLKLSFNKSPRKIKHELYSYNDEQIKANKIIQEATQNLIRNQLSPNQKKVKISQRSKSKSLNPNNSDDIVEIQNRKKKIKNFKMLSRELPDSAFTTYFGKPAFSNYGSGSTSNQKKSFNIMPHAGKNHPEFKQSYETALKKGKQIKPNYVPKKPIQVYHPSQEQMLKSDYYQIPIRKPNLINTVRFTEDKSYLQRKARTPKHNELNTIPSRESLHSNFQLKASKDSERKKLKKVTSQKNFQTMKNDHPLVNSRDNLRQLLEQKKRQQNKLAYKVTECYPLPYEQTDKDRQTKISRWSQMPPAGIKSPRSDHANDVFYPNTIWS